MSSIYQQHLQLIENRTSVLETDTYYGNVIHEINYDVVANDAVAITKDWMKKFAEWRDKIRILNYKEYPQYFDMTGKGSQLTVKLRTTEELIEIFLKQEEEQ